MIHIIVIYGLFFIFYKFSGFFQKRETPLWKIINKDVSTYEMIEKSKEEDDNPSWSTLVTILDLAWMFFGLSTHQWPFFAVLLILRIVLPTLARTQSEHGAKHMLWASRSFSIICAGIILYNFYSEYLELIKTLYL